MENTGTLAALLQAGHNDRVVTTTDNGWIEIRLDSAYKVNPTAKLDFLRIAGGEGEWTLYQLSDNGVCRGQATFIGTMVAALYGAIDTYFETL